MLRNRNKKQRTQWQFCIELPSWKRNTIMRKNIGILQITMAGLSFLCGSRHISAKMYEIFVELQQPYKTLSHNRSYKRISIF